MISFTRMYKENTTLLNICRFVTEAVMVVAFAFTLIYFGCDRTKIVGSSMQPVFQDMDCCLINRFAYAFSKPDRYDIIAFSMDGDDKVYVKRVIGLPGETVQIKDKKVYINGEPLADDVAQVEILTAGIAADEITLEKDEYFVLGDNRNNSEDSRFSNIGILNKDNIKGSVWAISSPFARVGLVK